MEKPINKFHWLILITILIISAYAAICIRNNGETLKIMTGMVERCARLGGGDSTLISHATIKTESGSYIISSVPDCSPGLKVNIFIKRGMLYFNTVYAAEKA